MVVTAAVSVIKPGGKKEPIVGPRRAVLVLAAPPKVFKAKGDFFVRVPNKVCSEVSGVLQFIPVDKSRIVGI